MKSNQKKFKNIDEYISTFSDDIKKILEQVRKTIKKAAPKAQEVISFKYLHLNNTGF